MVLAVFAFCALAFQVVLADEFWVRGRLASSRRTSTFSLGFTASAPT